MAERDNCRGCGSKDIVLVLSLGETPLANSFLDEGDLKKNEPVYPLDLFFCKKCFLVQLVEVVDPEVLFKNYIYVTGTSETMALHNSKLAEEVQKSRNLTKSDLVVEIASNDGSLLKCFQKYGLQTLGIEPAENIATIAREKGVETINLFFNEESVQEVQSKYGLANTVIANNVLAHVDDTLGFLKNVRALLKPEGVSIIEVPYLTNMLDNLEYDTIYHEHLCYFSLLALMQIYTRAGLSITRADKIDVHGGSLRIYACPDSKEIDHSSDIYQMAAIEKEHGFAEESTFHEFASKVKQNKADLINLVEDIRAKGKSIAVYGVPAKGNTLLNYCKMGKESLAYAVDRSPHKIGKYTPGSHIPVYHTDKLLEDQPDYVLLLAWNFKDEILRQQKTYISRGGHFILPLPNPAIIK